MATAAKKKAATKKRATTKRASSKRSTTKKGAAKKTSSKKSTSQKSSSRKNKLGVKNSLVNNINAHKKRGDSKSKKASTVNKEQYKKMEHNWEKEK